MNTTACKKLAVTAEEPSALSNMKEKFLEKRFKKASVALLGPIEKIMTDYAAQGYDLTVRQLYYRLVAANAIPNSMKSYKTIVGLLTDARMAGLLDWGVMVDRHRRSLRSSSWPDLKSFLNDVKYDFQVDKWLDQPNYVEVMIEKDALSGVFGPMCNELDVTFTANKGYSSSSSMYRAGKRFRSRALEGKKLHLIYFGDHDPSGRDMTRDISERVPLLGGEPIIHKGDAPIPLDIKIHRLALNIDQVRKYNPPENPCKLEDTRSPAYVAEFGNSSWELDALEPTTLKDLLFRTVEKLKDQELWEAAEAHELTLRQRLEKIINNANKVRKPRKKK